MMGNVSGVSQFLETVTLPSTQAGLESAPTQDFAAVMQQTSNESGTPLPLSTGDAFGRPAEENNANAAGSSSQTASSLAQSKLPAVTIVSGKDSLLRFTQSKSAQGQLQNHTGPAAELAGGATTSISKTATASQSAAANNPAVSKSGDSFTLAAKNVAATGKASSIPTSDPKASSLATSQTIPQVEDESAVAADAKAIAGDAAAALNVLPPAVQSAVAQPKVPKDTLSVDAKQAVKAADNKIASKLTAIIPQGTTDVPQSATPSLAINTAAPDVLAMPIAAASAGSFETSNLENGLSQTTTASGAFPAVVPPTAKGAALLTVNATQAAMAKGPVGFDATAAPTHATMTAPTAAVPLFDDSSAKTGEDQRAYSSTPQASTTTSATLGAQPPAILATGNSTVSAPDAVVATTSAGISGLTTQFTPATQGSATSTTAVLNASATPTGPATAAPKPGLQQSSRAGHTTAKPIAEKTSGTASISAAVQGVQAGTMTPGQSAKSSAESPVQASRLPNDHAAAATSNTKEALKPANPGPAETASQHGGAETKQTLADTLAATTPAAAKDSAEPTAAAVIAQPAVAQTALIGTMSNPVGAMASTPLSHTTSAAGTTASSTMASGTISAAQGSTGVSITGSLPHTTLSATPNSLEVGVSSGTHGWLKIRAELNAAGEVDASLTGANSAAASKLRGDLPALSSFLQSEKVQMGALDVRSALHSATTAFESSSTFSQAGSGQGGAGGANGATVSADAGAAGNRAQQQAQQGTDSAPGLADGKESDEIVLGRATDAAAYGNQTELGGSDGSSSVGYGAGGSWLNVRA